ncbi:hypothetical protein GTQ43_27365 [Nostoc sp. KVJ3]|nr:hypothetical protein [Nostoc sp. KVJ3]
MSNFSQNLDTYKVSIGSRVGSLLRSILSITGREYPSFNPSKIQSSSVGRNSSSHSRKVDAKAITPLQTGILPVNVSSSSLS